MKNKQLESDLLDKLANVKLMWQTNRQNLTAMQEKSILLACDLLQDAYKMELLKR